MKRLIILGILAFAAVVIGATAEYQTLRVAGTSTITGDIYYMVVESKDSNAIDTVMSDTIDILQDKYLNVGIEYVDATLADSANDSLIVIVHTMTNFDGADGHVLYTDTFHDTNGITTLAGTVTRHNLRTDTLGYNNLYFRAIFKDSVVLGAGEDDQTTSVAMRYHVVQRPYGE